MTDASYLLAIDQGTTSSRALLVDSRGQVAAMKQKEFQQYYPEPGWVEHDAEEIWSSQLAVIRELCQQLNGSDRLVGIGITNQRETTVLWDRKTGKAIANAIVWQDRRTAAFCEQLKAQGHAAMIQEKTGLIIDAYFSATKIRWLLDKTPGAREQAERGELAVGTIDSWLIWKLTGGKVHATDFSNASRTMIFNIHQGDWDNELLKLFDVPRSVLPAVKSSSEIYGYTLPELFGQATPIAGVAGDQQAALFGQLCLEPGMLKNTYGTGCFLMLNTGEQAMTSRHKLLTTIAWRLNGKTSYALEGSVFIGGAVVQWLRDGLGLIEHSKDIEALAAKASDNGGVYFVPAFTGLGAPYWDPYARGTIIGLTRGSRREHIARAALEAVAFQTRDVVEAMRLDTHIPLKELRVDGGASANASLMQFQADMLNAKVVRPKCLESTALGAAFFAGLATGFFPHLEAIQKLWQQESLFTPSMRDAERIRLYGAWQAAVKHASGWARDAEVKV